MKKFYLLVCLSFVVVSSWGQLLYEPFNYTPDALNGVAQQSGGVWVRINGGDSMLVAAGNLSYPGLAASAGNKVTYDGAGSDNYRTVTLTPVTAGTTYLSFILNVPALGGLTVTGGYFASLAQAASTTSYGGTVWTRLSTTAGKYNIGVSTRSNSVVTWLAADLDPGVSYFVVASYEIIAGAGNDLAKLWLNTTAFGGSEPPPDGTAAVGTDLSSAGIDKVLLRQDNLTNTPFVEVDELRVGTTWASVTPAGNVASLTISSPLAAFGNVCINTTAGPNSFTISGSNLTTANVTVGALTGFTYSTTSGGTYTTTLSLTQPGGTYSQQIFVRFDPTAVQSYNGNIAVGGGGASSVNVAATGAGVNTLPTVTSGAASAITQTSATVAGSIPATGCSAITAYGIEYSTTLGVPNGTGTPVASTNLAAGNFTSALNGLISSTTYYYHAFATNAAGTAYGAELNFTTASPNPTINTTTLTAFGNTCINTVAGPNSFTITGSNLTTANVTVGALAGFTYSTTSGGTYTTTLSLTQPGGAYSQQIFVRFSPTAVQSYNGNIPVAGGGVAATVNVAASGAGVNTAPTVTSGAASAITQTTATVAGSIPAAGCTAVTAYGIEYSTTNGFPNGTGTAVASTNLAGGNYTSSLTGLTASTIYYYHAYATNAGGTSYGAQQSFTTAAPPPPVLTATALTPFGTACVNTSPAPNSFTINGSNLTTAALTVGPLTGFTFSETAAGTYVTTLSITQTGGTQSKTVFVKFTPTAVQSYNGNIPVSGGGAPAISVPVIASGVNTLATVSTGTVASSNNNSAILNGSIAATGCSNVTAYGIEFSGINGFLNGNGTQVPSINLTGGNFSSTLTGLVQGATYYYKAYATNGGGTSYGLQQSFTVPSIGSGFHLYPSPVARGTSIRITVDGLTPGYYGLLLYDSEGRKVFQKDMNVQVNFINQTFTIPATLQAGIYRASLVNYKEEIGLQTILVQ